MKSRIFRIFLVLTASVFYTAGILSAQTSAESPVSSERQEQIRKVKSRPCVPIRSIPSEELAFKDGEKLHYVANYRLGGVSTDVGDAEIELHLTAHEGKPAYHAVINAKTRRFYDLFFKVRDLYEAKFYAENCLPFYFHRDVNEGGYTVSNEYFFNQENHDIHARVQKMHNAPLDTILPGRQCTFDLISLFYFARNLDFDNMKEGQSYPVSFAIDEEIFELSYQYVGKEVKNFGRLGKYRTLKFAAHVVAGEVFKGDEQLIIWITDDKNRIPLCFESPIIVGTVSGRLVEMENLKYELSSKIR